MKSILFSRPEARSLRPAPGSASFWFWVRVWLPALIACVVIACESTPTFSSDETSGWLRPFFEHWFGPIANQQWFWGHHLLRKAGHFTGYGLVGLSFMRGWLFTLAQRFAAVQKAVGWRLRAFGLGVLSAAGVASLDEWHQSFLPSRTGTPVDVLLDTVGATILAGLVTLVALRSRRSRNRDLQADFAEP